MSSDSENSNFTTNPIENNRSDVESPTTFSGLGNRITGWTSNLLATAAVLIIALVGGKQLVSYWVSNDSPPLQSGNTTLADAWPQLEFCSLHFGDSPMEMEFTRFTGDREQVFQWLESRCVKVLERDADGSPSTLTVDSLPIGPSETQMLEQCVKAVPRHQEKGKWRVFRVGDGFSIDSNSTPDLTAIGVPMVIGIKDNCGSVTSSRLVTWGMALGGVNSPNKTMDQTPSFVELENTPPQSQSTKPIEWKTYLSSTRSSDATDPSLGRLTMQNLIPPCSKRTMAINASQSGALVGFSGGFSNDVIDFFNHLRATEGWTIAKPWSHSGGIWDVRFVSTKKTDSFRSIKIQLRSDSNNELRGLLVLQMNEESELNKKATL
ncbi:MAG: SLC41A family transporter [Mariniblastus sp.]